ncbi:hypothetical protein B296_00049640 [Ensete ventricosum]|uniref:Uncharacterized protein n=1 Tax=Ensete ventricosum TaxID=4639 RepID=A0A426XEZ6_ENSVE|nr:hypothetical protein B296_00049640 [Ensete ventricosum]
MVGLGVGVEGEVGRSTVPARGYLVKAIFVGVILLWCCTLSVIVSIHVATVVPDFSLLSREHIDAPHLHNGGPVMAEEQLLITRICPHQARHTIVFVPGDELVVALQQRVTPQQVVEIPVVESPRGLQVERDECVVSSRWWTRRPQAAEELRVPVVAIVFFEWLYRILAVQPAFEAYTPRSSNRVTACRNQRVRSSRWAQKDS